jgi:5-formyltetrahydrofolate cyclo-ligase
MVPTSSTPEVDEKRRLRRTMAERRAGLSAGERDACSRAAVARLLALPAWGAARARAAGGAVTTVSGYVAIRGELDPAAALEAARVAGLAVALPRIDTRWPPRLRFHVTRGRQDLTDGPYGLTEPLTSCPEVEVEDLDLMLLPGIAFDAAGHRVGTGGAYYDDAGRRLRAKGAAALMIGVAYDFQIVERCPTEEHDVAVDLVVTESRVLGRGVDASS